MVTHKIGWAASRIGFRRRVQRLAGVALCVSVSLGSCRYVGFENPIDCPASQSVEPAPYVGQWEVKRLLGEATTGGPHVVTVSGADPCSLAFEVSGDSANAERTKGTLLLTRVHGDVIAAARLHTNWYLLKLDIRNGGAEIGVGDPKPQVVKTDIEGGALSGLAESLDDQLPVVNVTTSSQGLRSYLETRPDLFEEETVLQKK